MSFRVEISCNACGTALFSGTTPIGGKIPASFESMHEAYIAAVENGWAENQMNLTIHREQTQVTQHYCPECIGKLPSLLPVLKEGISQEFPGNSLMPRSKSEASN